MTATRISAFTALVAGGFALGGALALNDAQAAPRNSKSQIERGKYLVTVASCHDCHTPLKMGPNGPERDYSRALSGHPEDLVMPPAPAMAGEWNVAVGWTMTSWNGPWGTTYTANLTPDPETGTGTWDTQTFIDTIRNGRHMGKGRPIMPPMPIEMIRNFSDEDLTAIFAYIQSLPPIKNHVPQNTGPVASK